MKKVLSLMAVGALLLPMTSALAQGPGSAAVPFLLISPGARPAGMGEAFVSIADDATATYWNPAGMVFQERNQISFMHVNWLPQLADDLNYEHLTGVYSLGPTGSVGLSVIYLDLGEQTITGEDSPDPLGTFSSNEYAISGSYAAKLSENSSAGVSLKFIRSNLAGGVGVGAEKGDGQANAFAVDLGYLHRNLLIDKFNLGVNVSNVGPKITYIDAAQADPLPTNLRFGVSYHLIKQEFNSLILATEVDRLLTSSGDGLFEGMINTWKHGVTKYFIYNAGLEYWYNNFVALRTGYHDDKEGRVEYLTFGGGLRYSGLGIDFGYVQSLGKDADGHPLNDTMRFSLSYGW